jgi:subtilisin family serine protease
MFMKNFAFILFFVLSSVFVFAQTIDKNFVDGVVYFKIEDASGVVLPEYKGESEIRRVFKDFPEIASILSEVSANELVRPFKTPCPKVQKTYRLSFDKIEDADIVIRELSNIRYIDYSEKAPLYEIFMISNDSLIEDQYYLENVMAYEAWDIVSSDNRVLLAIVDDAVNIDHPDLADNVWINPVEIEDGEDTDGNGYIDDINGWDAAGNNNDPRPSGFGGALMFHGTHCSGIAAAVTNNEVGIAGVSNNNVSLMGVKSSSFPFLMSNPAEGVDYAVAAGAEIVSMSFGGQAAAFETLENIINFGSEQGIIFVAAAGNDGDETVMYPAGWENVIAVGASNQADELWEMSQRGEFIDLLAPGVDIMSTMHGGSEYSLQSGTSMACPLVSGAIALLKSHKPEASKAEIIYCLLAGCDDIDEINPDFLGKFGAGRMNVYNSIMCLNDQVGSSQENEQLFSIYPNPASDLIRLRFYDNKSREISIINPLGQEFIKTTASAPYSQIDISLLSPGLYIVIVKENGLQKSQKLFVH